MSIGNIQCFFSYYYLHHNVSRIRVLFAEDNIFCEHVDDDHYVCYCHVESRGVPQTITLNGTTCEPRDECATNNGGCAHLCTDTAEGFECSCFSADQNNKDSRGWKEPVWRLSDNGFDCNDIDECANETFVDFRCPSPGKCVNTPGFYKCISSVAISKSGILAAGEQHILIK